MNQKKSIFERWWFWLIVVVAIVGIIGALIPDAEPDSNTGITALQIRNDTVELTEGQSTDRYFQVTATGDFSENDLKMISSDTGIATVKFKEISLTRYVYFTVTGVSEGTAEIHFETADGSVCSEKITVIVRSDGTKETNGSNHSDSATVSTDTASTDTKTNASTSTKPASTSTSSQKPASTSTTPASSDTGTTSDTNTPQNSGGSSAGNSVTVPDHSETGNNLVWVPTNGGTKYHNKSTCSKMIDPIQVTINTAVANGYTACKRCYG